MTENNEIMENFSVNFFNESNIWVWTIFWGSIGHLKGRIT